MLNLNLGGNLLQWNRPVVMAILNITPDSFYGESRAFSKHDIDHKVQILLNQGADIIDIGAYSSRPGADHISIDEEIDRLKLFFDSCGDTLDKALLSIDTFRAEVVTFVLNYYGNVIVNDISGGNMDNEIQSVCAEHSLPYILMHMRGTPQTMMQNTEYTSLVSEIIDELKIQIDKATAQGIKDIIIDPGFGFSKTIEQNYELLSNLSDLAILEKPILAGISRKSMIYKTLNINPEESLCASSALHLQALMNGASILRVHDVPEAIQMIKLNYKLTSTCKKD